MTRSKKYNVVDLFCGAGGMSLGFEMTEGFKIIGAIDNWQPAIDTFLHNHPSVDPNKVICAGVDEIFSDNSNKFKEIRKHFKSKEVDIVIGGPPCQGMSLAGKRLANDPRNKLFKSFVDAVNFMRPKVFVMENVPGLLSLSNGEINKAILASFSEIGYNHFDLHAPQILKAECYGVPQIRRRLFYVGFREDIEPCFHSWPPKPNYRAFERNDVSCTPDFFAGQSELEALPKPITVGEAISDLPSLNSGEGSDELPYTKPKSNLSEFQKYCRNWSHSPHEKSEPTVFNHEAPKHTQKLLNLIKLAAPGKSVDPKYTDSKMWNPDVPGYTVKALGAGGGSTNRRAFHYDTRQVRGSTVRENARIQSFPDWFRFIGPKTHQMTQVGNAVPPLLAQAIGNALLEKLDTT